MNENLTDVMVYDRIYLISITVSNPLNVSDTEIDTVTQLLITNNMND